MTQKERKPKRFTLANLGNLRLFVGILAYTGALCPKCSYGTRRTSKRWAVCRRCGERVPRRELPEKVTA
jgi:hypothetical protein